MARASASIGGEVQVGTRGARAALKSFEGELAASAQRMGRIPGPNVSGGFSKSWTELKSKIDLTSTALKTVGAAGKKFFNMEEDLMATVRQLGAVTDGSEDMATQLKALAELGGKPGLTFELAAKGSANLQALGMSSKESRRYMEQLGNEIARTGGTTENLDGFLMQLKQTLGKNKVEMSDFKIMAEHLTGFMQIAGGLNRDNAKEFFAGVIERLAEMPRAMRSGRQATEALQASLKAVGGLQMEQSGFGAWWQQFMIDMRDLVMDWGKFEAGLKSIGKGFDLTDSQKAGRKNLKEARAAAERDRAERVALKEFDEQEKRLKLQLELDAARASGNAADIAAAEDRLDIARDAAEMAKALEVSEAMTAKFIADQNKMRREAEGKLKAAAAAKTLESENEALDIASLRARGKNRAADRRQRAANIREEKARLIGEGLSETDATRIATGKERNREDEEYFARTGRRKIRGQAAENRATGIDAAEREGFRNLRWVDEPRQRGDKSNIPGFAAVVTPERMNARQRIGELKRERESLNNKPELDGAQLDRLDAIKTELQTLNGLLTKSVFRQNPNARN